MSGSGPAPQVADDLIRQTTTRKSHRGSGQSKCKLASTATPRPGSRQPIAWCPRLPLAADLHVALRSLRADTPALAWSAGMFVGSAARLALLSGEELMKELDGDGAFTDR